VAKNKDKSAIVKGKMKINQMGGLEASFEAFASDSKFKQVLELSINGMNINQTVGYDGKEMWISVGGQVVMTVTGKDLDPIKDAVHAEKVVELVLLQDKGLELAIIGDSKLGDQELVGIRVSKKEHKDVSLFFDKKTGLLAKMEYRNLDFQTKQEVNEERVVRDYKKVDGQMRPSRVTIIRDGNNYVDMEITEVKIVDKLEDSTFAKP
jgi:hypothetical protein